MRTIICFLLIILATANTLPLRPDSHHTNLNVTSDSLKQIDKFLEDLLGDIYDQYIQNREDARRKKANFTDYDDGEMMQGDQPVENIESTVSPSNGTELSEYYRTMRNRTKDFWLQYQKETILHYLGRSNQNMSKIDSKQLSLLNLTDIHKFFNGTTIDNDYITEKIRSYYPSCEVPSNTDQEMWKDENVMNLYFNFDYSSYEKNQIIATAILRLYRLPQNTTKTAYKSDCENNTLTDDDKYLRVSIYWYTKSLRKRRVKKRLSDSKVIQESEPWVELSVKPATKAWSRGRNLGLAVVVEDQDGNTLKADKFFKGASCMVGASTPKPIPTIIIDAARQNNELARIQNLLGGNPKPSASSDVLLLPSVDICTLELPENQTLPPDYHHHLKACNLGVMLEKQQKQIKQEKFERLAVLPNMFQQTPPNHIRHQQHHLLLDNFDPRSKIIGKRVVIPNRDLQTLSKNITGSRIDR